MYKRRLLSAIGVAAAATLVMTACSDGGSGGSDDVPTVRFALDWTPNTSHSGLYYAQEAGLFEDAGINVEILPYSGSLPDTLIDAGAAECGVGFQDVSSVSLAAGANVTAVMALYQHWATAIGVRADNDEIQRPADLDGKIFAGFGGSDSLQIAAVVQADGGKGEFETVSLSTSAYEAVYSGTADFTIPSQVWEGIEAEVRGTPLKNFQFTDYGVPDNYSALVECNSDWLEDEPETATAFIQALQAGYEFAAKNPKEAGDALISANADVFSTPESEEVVRLSQEKISSDYLLDEDGKFGRMTEERWTALGNWLFEKNLLADSEGDPLTEAPDWPTFFTNKYLSK